MSTTLTNIKDTKYIEYYLVLNITVIIYSSEYENPPKCGEDDQMQNLQQTLNSRNDSLILLVMSYMGSRLKLLRMYWYRSMNQLELT